MHQEHRADPSHVWVEGYGLVRVAQSGQLAQVMGTAAIPTGPQLSSSLAALPQRQQHRVDPQPKQDDPQSSLFPSSKACRT